MTPQELLHQILKILMEENQKIRIIQITRTIQKIRTIRKIRTIQTTRIIQKTKERIQIKRVVMK